MPAANLGMGDHPEAKFPEDRTTQVAGIHRQQTKVTPDDFIYIRFAQVGPDDAAVPFLPRRRRLAHDAGLNLADQSEILDFTPLLPIEQLEEFLDIHASATLLESCLLYTSPSPRD